MNLYVFANLGVDSPQSLGVGDAGVGHRPQPRVFTVPGCSAKPGLYREFCKTDDHAETEDILKCQSRVGRGGPGNVRCTQPVHSSAVVNPD